MGFPIRYNHRGCLFGTGNFLPTPVKLTIEANMIMQIAREAVVFVQSSNGLKYKRQKDRNQKLKKHLAFNFNWTKYFSYVWISENCSDYKGLFLEISTF